MTETQPSVLPVFLEKKKKRSKSRVGGQMEEEKINMEAFEEREEEGMLMNQLPIAEHPQEIAKERYHRSLHALSCTNFRRFTGEILVLLPSGSENLSESILY